MHHTHLRPLAVVADHRYHRPTDNDHPFTCKHALCGFRSGQSLSYTFHYDHGFTDARQWL